MGVFLRGLIIGFCFLPVWTFAYTDSLVKKEEIIFHSPFEQKCFNTTLAGQTSGLNYFDLFMALDSFTTEDITIEKKKLLTDQIKRLEKEISGKPPDKAIKILYKTVHNHFFKKYEIKNHFPDLFSSGQFNCVSGSALYALILQELRIPYAIKETPSHVFLVAYPENQQILLETTDALRGYLAFDQTFKTNFVNYLKESKLISIEEFNSSTINVLFDKYYFKEENIDLRKLAGIQYYNDGIYLAEAGKFEKAFEQFQKGYLLFPSDKMAYLIVYTIANILKEEKYTEMRKVDYLCMASRFLNFGITRSEIINEFYRITQNHLINSWNESHYTDIYNKLNHCIADSTIRDEISMTYHYELARISFNRGNYTTALNYSKLAYSLRPNHADIQTLFVTSLFKNLSTKIEGKPMLVVLEPYLTEFPHLMKHPLFCNFVLTNHLIAFGQAYEINNPSEGEKYRLEFESLYERNKEAEVDKNLIGRCYSYAGIYHFKKGNTARAKSYFQKGLEYAPQSHELRNRLQMIQN